ncbi:hypothetical protein SDC9_156665 [bioreactor metagenome]|uniref:DUF4834 domain-containing protein n=1 Tax=bioreactor metagenome TaxID=1076179 RepID=A0A645F6U6_9ZZZZ|nr:DUF4834 family protein [Paludibacter sp.]
MNFLFFLFFLVIGIGVVVLLLILGFLRTIFGFGRRKNTFPGQESDNNKRNGNPFSSSKQKAKIFDKQEGEYVDYEELKD